MKKILIYIVVAIALAVVLRTIINNKKSKEAEVVEVAKQVDKINVNVVTSKREFINTNYTANGTFIPKQELSFPSEISGRVVSVLVDGGSKVSVGQILAIIKKDAIEVDMTQAKNNLQNAIIDNQRYENAYITGGVTKQQLDNSRLQLKNAQATVQAQNIRVNNTNVRSTISGIVNKRYIEPGSVVSPGSQMFDIVNINTLKLSVLVDESQISRIRIGQTVNVTVNAFPDKTYTGKISFIAPKASNSLNFPVEIEIQNDGLLKAGMYASALFKTNNGADHQSMLVVPATAFVDGVNSGQIFVAQNGIAKLIKVVVGKIYGDKVEIISGLNEGQQVITNGQINLDNGSKINIIK